MQFLQDLTVVLSIAAAVILLFRRLNQPPIIGYLIAGLIIGPHTPPMPLVTDMHSLEAMAEIGVIFLLFALGIEFNLGRLAKAGAKSVLCAVIEFGLMTAVGYGIGSWFGWSNIEKLVLSGVIGVTGTAIVSRTLLERAQHAAGWEELVAGMLIAEDIISVFLIAFFSTASGVAEFNLPAIAALLMRFVMLLTILMAVGIIVLPRILKAAERAGMDEVRSIVIVGICFGTALLTQKLGYSAALGAFLAGAMTSMGGPTSKLHETVAPFKDVFGAVFFVSVGMMIDPRWIITNWQTALGIATVVVAARIAVNFAAMATVGNFPVSSVQATLAMLPIGEFSFILAQLAQKGNLISQPIYPISVMLCLTTTIFSAQLLPLATESGINRVFPDRWLKLLSAYNEKLAGRATSALASQVWKLMRPSIIQIIINLAGISGLFLAADTVQERYALHESYGGIWILAAIITLPFLIALVRKTQAVALVLLEAVTQAAGEDIPPGAAHPVLTRAAIGIPTVLIAAGYMKLGALLLPPWPYAILPLLVVGTTGFLLWKKMIRLYSLLQVAMRDSLEKGDAEPETAANALSVFVGALSPEKVHLSPSRLHAGYWAVGKTLKKTGLRTKTGVSLLQISRGKDTLPSPGPGDRFEAEDELLLIGETEQLRQAEQLLKHGPIVESPLT